MAAVSGLAFFCTGPGQTLVVSEFNRPLRGAFGISESSLATAYMLATVAASLPLVYVGSVIDRIGPRRAMALVAGLFALACVGFGLFVQGIVTVGVGFFLLRFLGQGSLSVTSMHATAMWFHRRLGRIEGIKNVAVFGLWSMLPLAVNGSIEAFGWRSTYALLGLGVGVLVIPSALLLLRDRPEDVGQRLDGDGSDADGASTAPGGDASAPSEEMAFTLSEAWRTRAYWGVILPNVLTGLIGTALLFTRQPMAASAGLSDDVAAGAASAMFFMLAASSVPSGWLTDRFAPKGLFAVGLVGIALASATYLFASAPVLFIGGMALFGLAQMLIQVTSNTTLARYFGRRHHGAIRASATRLMVLGTSLGPVTLGVSNDWFGGYSPGLILMIALCAPVALVALSMRPPELSRASAAGA